MKFALLFGAWSIGARPIDFNNIMLNPRGLTGSELGICMVAKELAAMGNEVHLYTVHKENKPKMWDCVYLHDVNEIPLISSNTDAVISWSEPDLLRYVPNSCVKICYTMLNDWHFSQPGFSDVTDIFVTVCNMLKDRLIANMEPHDQSKWSVVPLGCTPELYSDQRVPGRIIWTSSADRGLHNLLEIFPKIKKAVPDAHLKIFYHFEYGNILNVEPNDTAAHPHIREMGNRLRYIKESIKRLSHLGVEHVGPVSRTQMVKELSEASIFAGSFDTVAFTEGFSVSTLEALASFTAPIITDCDCLGEVYTNSGAVIVKSPVRANLNQFAEEVIKALKDKNHADDVINKCRQFAEKYTWKNTAIQLQGLVINHSKFNES
jgi:glycosyltransferase involved in cell wall biosynthesis